MFSNESFDINLGSDQTDLDYNNSTDIVYELIIMRLSMTPKPQVKCLEPSYVLNY